MLTTGRWSRSRRPAVAAAGTAVLLAGLLVACTPTSGSAGPPGISAGPGSSTANHPTTPDSSPAVVTAPALSTSVAPVRTSLTVDASSGSSEITVAARSTVTGAASATTIPPAGRAASTITVTASDTTPTAGHPVTLGWTITAAGSPVAKAPVIVTVGGKTVKATSGADGKGSTVLPALEPGSVPVTVAYAGDAGPGAASGAVTLSVTGATEIDAYADDSTVSPGDDVSIGFDVTSRGRAIGGAVTVSYQGGSRSIKLDGRGHGSVTIPAGTWSVGMHTVRVDYPASGHLAASSSSVDVSVTENPACPAWAQACVDLSASTSWLQQDGKIIYGPVSISSGRPGYRTPAGTYQVYWKDKDHHSSLFNDAAMPNSVFFNGGIAFHEGDPGVWSHGCIHLTWSASQRYWDYLGYGATVVVYGYAPY